MEYGVSRFLRNVGNHQRKCMGYRSERLVHFHIHESIRSHLCIILCAGIMLHPFCPIISFRENFRRRSAQSLRGRWLCTSLSFLPSASQLHVLIFLHFIIFMLSYHSTESYSNILLGRRDLYGQTGIFWNIFSYMKHPPLSSTYNIYKYLQSQATDRLQVSWLRL